MACGRTRIRDGHSSGTPVTRRLQQPTRTARSRHDPEALRACAQSLRAVPIRSCSRWGLPCRRRYRQRGALLPHRFTLAVSSRCRAEQAVCSLWHFPWARTRRTLSGTVCPWSPDFPPRQSPSQTLPRKRGIGLRDRATENRPPRLRSVLAEARVKRCGKSAPRCRQRQRHGKPHREQDRIGMTLTRKRQVRPGQSFG